METMEAKNKSTTYRWAYLPFVFSSAAILATQVTAAPGGSQQYQDAKQVSSVNHEYVGGTTQIGFGVTDNGDVDVELNQVLSETENHSTGVGLWAGYDLKGDDKGILGRGAQVNHNWVGRDKAGNATHVNKVFAAYDRNEAGHDKATVGYGRENKDLFWEGHVSKGLSGRKDGRRVGTGTTIVSDRAYEYGVGGSVGTFMPDSNVRVRAGLDHEWSDKVGVGEKDARNTTLSGGIEKFFQGTGHSVNLDVAASKRTGGFADDDTDVTGRVGYRYDFGGASIYQPDRRYRRVRVEVPGARTPATYKTVPVYASKTTRTPYKQLVKSTMELEGQTFFKLNSSKLIPSAQTRLKQIAAQIRKSGYKGAIRITGNTCGLGDPKYDQILSEKRAREVKNFLIRNGFNPNHLIARGLGKGHPKYPNTPSQGFKNRRVDIEYVSERKAYKTGYRSDTKRVQTGTRQVQLGSGRPGTPRVVWRTEVVPTSPAWIKRALHNNIRHNTNINTFETTEGSPTTPQNQAPTAVNDLATVACGGPVTIDVLGNDSDPDNDTLSIVSFTQPANGVVTRGNNGELIYTSNGNGCGLPDDFTYTITDGNGNTSTATVTVTVSDDVVEAADDTATTNEGEAVTINVLANDDGDATITRIVSGPSNGSATIVNGQIVYTPNPGFTGIDTFTYEVTDPNGNLTTATVTVTVGGVKAGNDTAKTGEGQPVTINVLANDDNDATIIPGSVSNPSNGTATIVNGQIVYTPNPGFSGVDTFTYDVTDPDGNTTTATVTVTVIDGDVKAENDTARTNEGEAVTIDVLANDDNDATIIPGSVSNPSNGTATIVNGQIVYTPNPGFSGVDTFTYDVTDPDGNTTTATVTVTVLPDGKPIAVSDTASTGCNAPVTIDVVGNDTDPDGDTLTIQSFTQPSTGTVTRAANGQLTYTPDGTACGLPDDFTYTITDGNGNTSTGTVTVNVDAAPNKPPVAQDDSATTPQGTPVTLTTLSNDSDPDGDTLTITGIQNPANGTAVVSANGQGIVYTPNPGFVGTETFTYTISDGNGHTVTATETVVVTAPENVPPKANDDTGATGCAPITINVLDNDSDLDGDALSIVGVSGASLGTAVISGNTIVYTPSDTCGKGNTGTDNFSYTISDGHGHVVSANVTVNVKGVTNGGKTDAEPDDASTVQDQPVVINVLANDKGEGLRIIAVDKPDHGTAIIVGGSIKYTPAPGFTGIDRFWYDIVDENGYNDAALVVVFVEEKTSPIPAPKRK